MTIDRRQLFTLAWKSVIAHVVGERSCVGTLDMSQPMYEAAHPLSLE